MFTASQYRRLAAIVALMMLGLGWLGWRLFEIQILRHPELGAKARRLASTTRVLPAWRGQIRDRHGTVLAGSVPVRTIYTRPSLWSNRVDQLARTCGPLLNIPPSELAARVQACLQRSGGDPANLPKAIVLKRNVSVEEWRVISSALALESFGISRIGGPAAEKIRIDGLRRRLLFAREGEIRRYPYPEEVGQLLGLVRCQDNGISLRGQGGIEGSFNEVLSGTDGLCISEQDASGDELLLRREYYRPASNGNNVVLTIDLRLHKILEDVLTKAQRKHQSRGGSALVMDPRTFEILAATSVPSLDPNQLGASPGTNWRNPPFSDRVEPGSTFKLITLAAALDQGLASLDSGVYCEDGRYVINRVAVTDHGHHGLLSLRQAFAKSSNIAFAKTALALGPERFYGYITNFGFGKRTGIPIADETSGVIARPAGWSTMSLTRAGFGQGLSVSQLQMAVAMCVIANGGRLMKPLLVRRIESPQGRALQEFQPRFVRQVVRPETARQVREALKAVVSPGGTGAQAALDHYTLAAKTGTAQKSDAHGYREGLFYSSMIGFLPADTPQVVIAVALDEPHVGHLAGEVIAPMFRSMAEQIAECLSIPPDKDPSRQVPSSLPRSEPSLADRRPIDRNRPSVRIAAQRAAFASTR